MQIMMMMMITIKTITIIVHFNTTTTTHLTVRAKKTTLKHDDQDKDGSLNVLDVVTVHRGYRNLKEEDDLTKNICSCKQQLASEPRKRHNATQTPTSLINWQQCVAERHSRMSESQKPCYCCEKSCTCMVATANIRDYSNYSEIQRCLRHCQHTVKPTSRCFHHHLHQYPRYQEENKGAAAAAIIDRSFKRRKRCFSGRHYCRSQVYRLQQKQHCSSVSHLPNTCTKSSLNSSDGKNKQLSCSSAMQEIAIEIDAATMTEDNTTPVTSNFAFKVAADSALAPIIRAPIHVDSDDDGRKKRLKRRSSFNSNTTIETDELSNEVVMDYNVHGFNSVGHYYCRCCDHARFDDTPIVVRPIQNECVKIKRKRFIAADDYCSSCSRSSSCSCSYVHSSSCSSFEEWPLKSRHSVSSAPHSSCAFSVSADCHRCHPHRETLKTSTEDLRGHENYLNGQAEQEIQFQSVVQETESSAHTSRCSSVNISFCSCNSKTCHYYNCSCEDSHTGVMCTAKDVTTASLTLSKFSKFEGEEGHSSTLTPLTNPSSVVSTPGDEGDVTMRSLSNAFSEDTSSQSHSAEYFSLSSMNQMSQGTPRKLPANNKATSTPTAVIPV